MNILNNIDKDKALALYAGVISCAIDGLVSKKTEPEELIAIGQKFLDSVTITPEQRIEKMKSEGWVTPDSDELGLEGFDLPSWHHVFCGEVNDYAEIIIAKPQLEGGIILWCTPQGEIVEPRLVHLFPKRPSDPADIGNKKPVNS